MVALVKYEGGHLDEMRGYAKEFSASGYFKDARDAAQALVKVQAGRELGIPPVAAMTGIHIVEGKVSLGANLIAAQIKGSGKYRYRIKEHTAEACVIEFFERIGDKWESLGESSFTMADAKAAGLAGRNVWKSYPKNMLFARAISNGARFHCPDVFTMPVYTPEEMGATVNGDGEILDVQEVTPEPPAPKKEKPAPKKEHPSITYCRDLFNAEGEEEWKVVHDSRGPWWDSIQKSQREKIEVFEQFTHGRTQRLPLSLALVNNDEDFLPVATEWVNGILAALGETAIGGE